MSYQDVSAAPPDEGPPPPSKADLYSYKFDTWYTSDPNAQVVCLIIANIICVFLLMALFGITGSLASEAGFNYYAEMAWMSWGQLSGTGGSPDGGLWGTRIVGVVCAFMGMFVFSLICAFIEEAINAKLESIRKGKSKVLDKGFVLIVGWSDRILPLINQLCLASESDGGGILVVLGEKDKEWMDGYLQDNVQDLMGSTIVTRSGSPIDIFSLEKVNARDARAIVVLSTIRDADESDSQTIRSVLALTAILGTPREDGIKGHVVCEICDIDNAEIVHLCFMDAAFAKEIVKPVVASDLTGRLMILCCLEPGIARVFAHILAFDFNEFYFKEWLGEGDPPYNMDLTGRRFADVCFMFEDAVPFGIRIADENKRSEDQSVIMVNPPGDTIIERGDQIIVIADDNDSYWPDKLQMVDPGMNPEREEQADDPVNLMLIGFRRDLDDMIAEVDKWVEKGSALMLFCDTPIPERMKALKAGGLEVEKLQNVVLHHFEGNPMLLPNLRDVEPQNYTGIIVLTESRDGVEGLSCDSRTMVTTLLIRDIQKQHAANGVLVSEILDPRTTELVKLAKMNDFICANDFVSMALAQMAEEEDIHPLVEDLFSPEGSEMHIKDILLYALPDENLNFWELVTRARNRAEVCLGWIRADEFENGAAVPNLNPADKQQRYTWSYGDQLVVLSED